MIHLARALAVRSQTVRPPHIEPVLAAPELDAQLSTTASVRISTDPTDARRTVIAGRFAAVCAALDQLVRDQEALI